MKRKLFTLLVAGSGFVLATWGALPVHGKGVQGPTSRYVKGSQQSKNVGATKLFDGGERVPICFPGDQKCSGRFDGIRLEPVYFSGRSYATKLLDGPVPICFPGDQKCNGRFDGTRLEPIYFSGRSYAKLLDGGGPVPICFPGDQKCK